MKGTALGLRLFLFWSLLLSAGSLIDLSVATAQITTANFRGTIVDSAGQPLEGVSVVIESAVQRIKKEAETNAEGQFAFTGLRVGGPYIVKAQRQGLATATREGVQLQAGNNDSVTISLAPVEVMQVVATQGGGSPSQKSTFYASEINRLPSVSQDPKDIIRLSPDAYVDGDNLSIGGANNRFNSITVDGIRQNDDFGLNNSGYPTQRSPISLQSIQELSVEKAPFDVRYNNFLGGQVNVITKSGTNEFEGSVSSTYTSQELTGKKTKDRTFDSKFEERRLGLTLGGPILTDKLFFFASVEGLDASVPNSFGPLGSGAPTEIERVTIEDVLRAQAIARTVYGFEPGETGQSLREGDLKLLTKFDWVINDTHRLEARYQRASGSNVVTGDNNRTQNRLTLTSNWYERRDTLDTLAFRLLSDWNDRLSSKVEVSGKQVKTRQDPLKADDFMQADITTGTAPNTGTIRLGPDSFRHLNVLDNETKQLTAEVNYLLNDHLLTGGLDYQRVDVYNLFVPNSKGDVDYPSLDAFEAKTPSGLFYNNAVTNNAQDAAVDWYYDVTSLFVQDEWQASPRLTVRYGIRSDLYGSDESVKRNPVFAERYGFDNTATLEGKDVLLPRFGVSYKATEKLNLRGGLGLFSGGTPNVWISNIYTNDGVSTDDARATAAPGFDGRNIPESLKSQLVAGGGNVDALDPDFKIPQTWKLGAGLDYRFDIPSVGENFVFEFDYTYSKVRYDVLWKDLRRNLASIPNNTPTAVGPDGRSLYDLDPTVTAATDFNVQRGYDLLLTNTEEGFGHTATMSLRKRIGTGLEVSGAYAWQNVKDVNPGTSSRSASNYGQVAIGLDPNDPELARSNYERTHRFLITTSYEENFFDKLTSSVALFMERRSGQPYSYTFGGDRNALGALFGEDREFSQRNRMLFYVPKGDGSDVVLDGIDEATFNAYLNRTGLDEYRGKIAPRNAFTSDWVSQIDMRLSQELPGFAERNRARISLDVENLPNLLNKKWGQVKQVGFPYTVAVTNVRFDPATQRYVYSNLDQRDPEAVRLLESVWKLQVGVSYDF